MINHTLRNGTLVPIFALATAIVGALGGCAVKQNPALESLQTDLAQTRSDAATVRRAPSAVDDAVQAVDRAQRAQRDGLAKEEVDHAIYVAHRRIEIANAQSTEKGAEEEIARIGTQRERVVADARTQDAERRTAIAQSDLRETQRWLDEQSARTRAGERNNSALEAKLAALRQELDATENERGLLFTLGGDILFDVGQSNLRSGARQRLDRLAGFLADYPERRIRIEGHTDATGGQDANLRLSAARAESVRRAFIDEGISFQRLESHGNGADSPVATNETSSGRQQNRRVEVLLLRDDRAATSAVR